MAWLNDALTQLPHHRQSLAFEQAAAQTPQVIDSCSKVRFVERSRSGDQLKSSRERPGPLELDRESYIHASEHLRVSRPDQMVVAVDQTARQSFSANRSLTSATVIAIAEQSALFRIAGGGPPHTQHQIRPSQIQVKQPGSQRH